MGTAANMRASRLSVWVVWLHCDVADLSVTVACRTGQQCQSSLFTPRTFTPLPSGAALATVGSMQDTSRTLGSDGYRRQYRHDP